MSLGSSKGTTESMSHPGGLQHLQQAQPEQGADSTVSPGGLSSGGLDSGSSGSWSSLTSQLSALVFSLHIPPTLSLPIPGYQDSPFNQQTTPQPGLKLALMVHGFHDHGEAEAPPHGGL